MSFKRLFTITTAITVLCVALAGCVQLPERTIKEAPEEVAPYTATQMYMVLTSRKGEMRDVYTDRIFDVEVNDAGITYDSSFNAMIKDYIEKLHVMTRMCSDRGIELSIAETKELQEEAGRYMEEFATSGNTYDISADDVVRIKGDLLLVEKLREQIIEQAGIEVSESDARVMDVWRIECEDSEKAYAALEDINNNPEASFETLARRNSCNSEIELKVTRGELGQSVEEVVFNLEDGEVSPVIPGEDHYFIFKCVKGYDEEATAERKAEMAVERQNRAVALKYEEYILENPFTVDKEAWKEAVKMYDNNPELPDVYKTY